MNATSSDSQVRRAFLLGEELCPPADEVALPPVRTVRPTPGFWGALGWVVVWIILCMIIPLFAAAFVAGLTNVPLQTYFEPALFGGQLLGASVAIVLLVRKHGGAWAKEVGLTRLPILPALLAIASVPGLKVVLVGIIGIMAALFGAQDPTTAMVTEAATHTSWWLMVLAIAVGPAVNEELWFRGYLGRGLVGRYGPMVGVLLASMFFGLAHLSFVQGTYAAVMGLWLHGVYLMTRSLWIPILVHFLNNALAVVGAMIVASGGGAAQEPTGDARMILLGVAAASLVVLAAATWGLYLLRVRGDEPAR